MVFRGFSDFNISLLGKHYWRLLRGEQTLLQKVFKGRNYHRNSIGDAKLGFYPSYALRSILSAEDFVAKWASWRMGNG